MSKYVITFAKEGLLKYTSHLDMVRLFERTLKRAEIKLQYSQGFNPHPKLVFAQPLSLGYSAENEIVEIETKDDLAEAQLQESIAIKMPEGITIKNVSKMTDKSKSLAALTKVAEYTIYFPEEAKFEAGICEKFMAQDSILVEKKQKKTGKLKEIDIKDMIFELEFFDSMENAEGAVLKTTVAQGSAQNLSPELLITAFLKFSGMQCGREEIDVVRNKLIFE